MSDNYQSADLGYAAGLGHGQGIRAATFNVGNSQSIAATQNRPNSEHGIQYAADPTKTEATRIEAYTPAPSPVYRPGAVSGEQGVGAGHTHAGELRNNGQSTAIYR